MYNAQQKEQFLKEKTQTAKISGNLEQIFLLSEEKEKQCGKDLCNWNSDQIIEFYKYYSTPNIQSLIMINTALREYTTWCISNGLVNDSQNHYGEIDAEALTKCIDLNKLRNTILTREQLLNNISDLPNYSDRFIFLALFEGVPPTDGTLYKIKRSDVKVNTLTLPSGKQIIISNELIRVMDFADNETEFQTMTNMRHAILHYDQSDTVLKRITTQRLGNPTIWVGNRIRKAAKYMGLNPGITIKSIVESGRLDYIKRIVDAYDVSISDAIANTEYRKMHEDIYGKLQNATIYEKTYGQLIERG